MSIADIRKDYKLASLSESDADPDPIALFDRWMKEALRAEIPEPTAMSLATIENVGGDARPSSRIVLLKGFDAAGFVFFTNYASRKGLALASNRHAALLFHWVELERQVRIEGSIDKVSAQESDEYFASRPLASRHGAWASPQSEVIASREWLEAEFQRAAARYADQPPRPPQWGGYRVTPERFEFWQGRRSRLHDRIQYRRDSPGWKIERLAP